MLAATEVVDTCTSLPHALRRCPANVYARLDPAGSSSVSPTTSFHVRFSRLLDPTTATRQSICLQPLLTNVVGPSACMAGIFSEPSYDPVKREVDYHVTSGNLIPGLRYQLTLYSGQQVGSGGVFSYDGVALAQPFKIEFQVFGTGDVLPAYDTGPTGDHYCTPPPGCPPERLDCARSVSELFTTCASGGCHGISLAADAGIPDQASEDLLLGSIAGLTTTALNQPAHETQTGEGAGTVQLDGLRFGRSMAVLSSTNGPGYSYLIYKLLANRHTPLRVPWSDGSATVDPTEVALLRENLVVGMPMPPDTATTAKLRPGEAEWVSEWILMGARLPAEPCGSEMPDGGTSDGGISDGGNTDGGALDGGP